MVIKSRCGALSIGIEQDRTSAYVREWPGKAGRRT